MPKKKVIILTTGGTIAMRKELEGVVTSETGNKKIADLEGLDQIADVETREFFNIPSPYMTPIRMWKLSREVQRIVNDPDITGIVVTHGTDTLEETAYFLDITVKTEKPIVLTAAMRNINELGTDGPRNVFSSLKVAVSENAKSCGAVVCLNDEIHAAREVTKTYTSNVATFESPGFGPLGIVDEDGVFFFRKSLIKTYIETDKIEPRIALIKTFTGDNGDIIDFVRENGYKGIVLEGFGRGNVPPEIVPAIKRCIDQKIPVILVSRCYKGRVLDIYAYKGGGANLRNMGIILGHEQTSAKSRIKLMVLMGMTESFEKIREYFKMN